jgi:hypothetical protein
MAKRKRDGTQTVGGAKKLKKASVQPKHDHSSEDGDVSHEMWNDWPAPKEDMEAASGFLKGWYVGSLSLSEWRTSTVAVAYVV